MNYSFISPESTSHWNDYHRIRRTVLWEARGNFGSYDETHPDEYKSNHHPKILVLEDEPIGVIRIDIVGDVAWFRRVAISEHQQRRGHGRFLLREAESFSLKRGIKHIRSSVDSEAIGFYRKLDYCSESQDESLMFKFLRAN